MVSTPKKRKSDRRLLSHLVDFDQDIIIGNTVKDRQENASVNERTGEKEFTVYFSSSSLTANENGIKMKTLGKCFNEKTDKKTGDIGDTVKYKIQNAISTPIDSFITPQIILAIRSPNASSGQDAANTERGEHIGFLHILKTYPKRTTNYMS